MSSRPRRTSAAIAALVVLAVLAACVPQRGVAMHVENDSAETFYLGVGSADGVKAWYRVDPGASGLAVGPDPNASGMSMTLLGEMCDAFMESSDTQPGRMRIDAGGNIAVEAGVPDDLRAVAPLPRTDGCR